jgi:hypothetical protein
MASRRNKNSSLNKTEESSVSTEESFFGFNEPYSNYSFDSSTSEEASEPTLINVESEAATPPLVEEVEPTPVPVESEAATPPLVEEVEPTPVPVETQAFVPVVEDKATEEQSGKAKRSWQKPGPLPKKKSPRNVPKFS